MLADSLVFGLALGVVRGGRLTRLAEAQIDGWQLAIGAFALQHGCAWAAASGVDLARKIGPFVFTGTMLLLVLVCWRNRGERSWWWIGAGIVMNLLVIAANGGRMPVSLSALQTVGLTHLAPFLEDPGNITHTALGPDTRLRLLADVIPIPPPYPRPRVVSIGDVLLAGGAFCWLQTKMGVPLRGAGPLGRRKPAAGGTAAKS